MGMNMGWMEIMEMEIVEVMAAGWARPDAATRVMQIVIYRTVSVEFSVRLYGTLDKRRNKQACNASNVTATASRALTLERTLACLI
jgi:hypothetical protein